MFSASRWLLEQETQRSRVAPVDASSVETRDGGDGGDGDWWEVIADAADVPLQEEVESGEPMESEPLSAMQNAEVMLTFMVRACSDTEGAQTADANLFQILSKCQNRISRESSGLLQEVAALEEFLDIYEKLSKDLEDTFFVVVFFLAGKTCLLSYSPTELPFVQFQVLSRFSSIQVCCCVFAFTVFSSCFPKETSVQERKEYCLARSPRQPHSADSLGFCFLLAPRVSPRVVYRSRERKKWVNMVKQ